MRIATAAAAAAAADDDDVRIGVLIAPPGRRCVT